jgi:hypothetical protein
MSDHHRAPTLGECRAAYQEGKIAGETNKPVGDNPYPFTIHVARPLMSAVNQQHLAWLNGWREHHPALSLMLSQAPMTILSELSGVAA